MGLIVSLDGCITHTNNLALSEIGGYYLEVIKAIYCAYIGSMRRGNGVQLSHKLLLDGRRGHVEVYRLGDGSG